jgi:hypothetical protein
MGRKELVLAAASAIAVFVISGIVIRTHIVNAQSSAFTIKYVEKSGDWTRDSFYSRRSDGSDVESRVTTGPDGKQYEQRTVIDTAQRTRVVIDGMTESITTYPLSQARVESYKKPALNCVPEEPSPQLQDHQAIPDSIRRTISARRVLACPRPWLRHFAIGDLRPRQPRA